VNFLPVLLRELAVAARRTATYRQRVIFAALALGTVVVLFAFLPVTRLSGPMIFQGISWGGFVLCVLEGLRAAADSISLERREGTLGLLLLTDLDGPRIVLGKFGAALIQAAPVVLSILPAFALPLLIGGVTAGECGRLMITFVATLCFMLAAGMLVSSLVVVPVAAYVGTALLAAALTVPLAVAASFSGVIFAPAFSGRILLGLAGPAGMILSVGDKMFMATAISFELGLLATVLWTALLLAAAGMVLQRSPRLEVKNIEHWWHRLLRPRVDRIQGWGGASAQSSPGVWLAERTLPGQRLLWMLTGAGLAVCFIIGLVGGKAAMPIVFGWQITFALVLKLWLAAVAPQAFNNSKRSGALELLLCTPLTPREIVRGQMDAIYASFIGPALATGMGFTVAGMIGRAVTSGGRAFDNEAALFVFGVFWFLSFLLDLHALAYMGMWYGLTTARADRAVGKTIFAVLVLPWLTVVVPFLGCLGMVVWPFIWISWASKRLDVRFREEAMVALDATDDSGWLPWKQRTRA
jgi:ABC-type transport system involved in multi-copper enzyme maturation permease subunit